MNHLTALGREKLSTLVIILSLIITLITSLGVTFLDVKINNIELIDGELYTIITDKGNVNIVPGDILRIERSNTKRTLTSEAQELGKIFTNKGFIYLSSKDKYAPIGNELMKSVDNLGLPLWERSGVDWKTIKKLRYSIGIPEQYTNLVVFLLDLRNIALTIGCIALLVLIFPLRINDDKNEEASTANQVQELQREKFAEIEKLVK
ncbi:MAG: hypothetical protein GX958_10120 [Desulfitobacterium sp.]|nr:hypothetical protein [Desulfitobacterium sp.]